MEALYGFFVIANIMIDMLPRFKAYTKHAKPIVPAIMKRRGITGPTNKNRKKFAKKL